MNSKRAKKLRQLARNQSHQMPEREIHTLTREIVHSVVTPGMKVKRLVEKAVNNPASHRGIYRNLKKVIKA